MGLHTVGAKTSAGPKPGTGRVLLFDEPVVRDLQRNVDDRGDLVEYLRSSWNLMPHPIGQVYLVTDPGAFTVRAFHRHRELWDIFSIVSGSALFYCVKAELWGQDFHVNVSRRIVLSDRRPQVLIVPPGWWHGWQSLEPYTRLLSIASHEYNREQPDEERVSWESFPTAVAWGVQPR